MDWMDGHLVRSLSLGEGLVLLILKFFFFIAHNDLFLDFDWITPVLIKTNGLPSSRLATQNL
jgi:hypothetical protein